MTLPVDPLPTADPPAPPAGPPTKEGLSDAEKVRRVVRQVPSRKDAKKSKGPGRPAAPRPSSAGPPAEPPAADEAIPPGEAAFWARQLQDIFAGVADLRGGVGGGLPVDPSTGAHWRLPDKLAEAAGESAALCARKYFPAAAERPELVLALVLVPFLVRALRIELVAFLHARATAAGGQRRHFRTEGVREDLPGPEFATAPFKMPDR